MIQIEWIRLAKYAKTCITGVTISSECIANLSSCYTHFLIVSKTNIDVTNYMHVELIWIVCSNECKWTKSETISHTSSHIELSIKTKSYCFWTTFEFLKCHFRQKIDVTLKLITSNIVKAFASSASVPSVSNASS